MSESVLIALISAGLPTLATIVTTIFRGRASAKHSAKQSILQMIMEDHLAVAEKRLPTNYQNILQEYDKYRQNGGNTYISQKVSEYQSWFANTQKHVLEGEK